MLRSAQHDRFMHTVILRSRATKNLVPGIKNLSWFCHCEEPVRAMPVLTEAEGSQSPRKKGGDCIASLVVT